MAKKKSQAGGRKRKQKGGMFFGPGQKVPPFMVKGFGPMPIHPFGGGVIAVQGDPNAKLVGNGQHGGSFIPGSGNISVARQLGVLNPQHGGSFFGDVGNFFTHTIPDVLHKVPIISTIGNAGGALLQASGDPRLKLAGQALGAAGGVAAQHGLGRRHHKQRGGDSQYAWA